MTPDDQHEDFTGSGQREFRGRSLPRPTQEEFLGQRLQSRQDSSERRRHRMGLRTALALAVICLLVAPTTADTWSVTRKARTGSMPWSVTVSADGSQLWVSMVGHRDRDNVWRYDAGSLKVLAKSSFFGHAVESELIENETRLLVTNSREDLLMELDAKTLKVVRRIPTDRAPKDLDVSSDKTVAFVANYGSGTLSAIRLDDGSTTHVKTGRQSRGATAAADSSEVYVMNFGEQTVTVVDTTDFEVTDRIRACKNPRHGAIAGQSLLVTCFGSRHVLVIDRSSHKILRRLEVGRGPKTIAVSKDGRLAVTANEKGNSVSIINTSTWEVVTKPLTARQPCGVTIAPNGRRIYVTARGSNQLLMLERSEAGL